MVVVIFWWCARAENGTFETQFQCHSRQNTHKQTIHTDKYMHECVATHAKRQREVSFDLTADCQSSTD